MGYRRLSVRVRYKHVTITKLSLQKDREHPWRRNVSAVVVTSLCVLNKEDYRCFHVHPCARRGHVYGGVQSPVQELSANNLLEATAPLIIPSFLSCFRKVVLCRRRLVSMYLAKKTSLTC